ncbi:hypothetical protein [Helicobacter cappadocius]|uniref:Uncharacterized protein n=1 Tax=Helicobacter cappadocius TaxID=3063998 RepID=A0AA90SS54_9HELI|nr:MULTISPECIES: hypothetical protein [unclassified Helicobacter]MDO7252696.1 hypothetical protein [Helicobacter sp. faydin-H75]MDP2538564.1 hypothetical protein [Helicobacter sp. faydin-H76]
MIKMFISKKEGSDLVRFNYKPKIKKSQIEKILGQDWEHKKLTKKQIKDFGLGFLLDVFGSRTQYSLYEISKSRQFSNYCLGCFDSGDKIKLYRRIYFSSEKKFRKILSLSNSEELLDFYDFDSSNLSLVGMDYLRVFQDIYHFRIFRFSYSPLTRFSIEVYDSINFLGQFDFDMEFDEMSTFIPMNEEEMEDKIFYGGLPVLNEQLYLFGAKHLLLINQADIEYLLVQNFK